ncbi:protein of unknown function [Sterolibacterium denitrificans]|uniref:Protein CopB n=1 Tax=Sterolibacterium denitrificans TaxID=157592 RepID=A0A7Z7HRJ6_9PROT|nr:hypothetical protein [Sterolibacterium denitrificans]SMB27651.1 protein of unknown function [Sterolibacterium denitrificans]
MTTPAIMKPPAKTAAERQKAYRERRAKEAGEQRINTWVAAAAVRYLNELASRHGLTQKVMLERLILGADKAKATQEQPAAEKEKAKAEKPKVRIKAPANKPIKATQPTAVLSTPPVQASLWDD